MNCILILLLTTIKKILDNSLNIHIKNDQNLLFCDVKTKEIIKLHEVNSYLTRLNKKYNIVNKLHNHMLKHTYASVLDKLDTEEDTKLEKYLTQNNIIISQLH